MRPDIQGTLTLKKEGGREGYINSGYRRKIIGTFTIENIFNKKLTKKLVS